jgi:hypothetical protein
MKSRRSIATSMVVAALTLTAASGVRAADQPPVSSTDQPVKVKPKAKPLPDVPFFSLIDDRLTYAYVYHGIDASFSPNPGGGYNGNTNLNVLALTHFDVWQYGTNFINILDIKSDKNDPASPCIAPGLIPTASGGVTSSDCSGANDLYVIARSTFGFNEIFDTKIFKVGPLRNVSLELGGDIDAQNNYFGSFERMGLVGLQFAFDLPYKGFFNVAPMFKTETEHNAFTQCGSAYAAPAPACNLSGEEHFANTWAVESNYAMDLGFLPESMQFFMISGRFAFYGPKGPISGIPGMEPTKTELNFEPIRLTFDASKAMWGHKYSHMVDYWVAYRYWQNQYGLNANSAPGICTVNGVSTHACTSSYFATGVTVKF